MNLKHFLIVVFTVFGFQATIYAQENEELFTIYLVRHAEKEISSKNPPLSKCGKQRAASLSNFLDKVTLNAIYSTDYIRTKSTAEPTAIAKKMEVKLYNPRALSDFAKLLIDRKEDALVIGHSNTTGVLAGLLINQEIGSFDESIYNRIYQIVFYKKKGRLHLLQSSFVCDK